MRIADKMTVRAKQAGDLPGADSLKQEGTDEERKGEIKDQLRQYEARSRAGQSQGEGRKEEAQHHADCVVRGPAPADG